MQLYLNPMPRLLNPKERKQFNADYKRILAEIAELRKWRKQAEANYKADPNCTTPYPLP